MTAAVVHDIDVFARPLALIFLLGLVVLGLALVDWARVGAWLRWRAQRPRPHHYVPCGGWPAFRAALARWEANRPTRR